MGDIEPLRGALAYIITRYLESDSLAEVKQLRIFIGVKLLLSTFGSDVAISSGDFENSTLNSDVIDDFMMITVPMRRDDIDMSMSLGHLNRLQIIAGGFLFLSVRDVQRVALWYQDNNNKVLNIMLGDDAKSAVLTIDLIDWSAGTLTSLRNRVESIQSMSEGRMFLSSICDQYTHENIRIRLVNFRLQAVRMQINNGASMCAQIRDDDRYRTALLRDAHSLTYKALVVQTINTSRPIRDPVIYFNY